MDKIQSNVMECAGKGLVYIECDLANFTGRGCPTCRLGKKVPVKVNEILAIGFYSK